MASCSRIRPACRSSWSATRSSRWSRRSSGILGAGQSLAEPSSATAPDALYAHLHGLYWPVADLAARDPLVLLADDLHWADADSLRWLVFLAQRVEDLPVVLIGGPRPAEPGADQALIDVFAGAAQILRVRRRSPPAQRSAGPTPPGRRGRRVRRGLPPRHRRERVPPRRTARRADRPADRQDRAEAGRVLEFGTERLGQAVRRRLRRLPEEATTVARAVACSVPRRPWATSRPRRDMNRMPSASRRRRWRPIGVLAGHGDVELDGRRGQR